MNKVVLFGNLGKDPEVKHLESGKVVASFTLATNEAYTVNNEKKTVTQWHNIVTWGKTAETAEKYLKKGASVIVEGKITYRSYENKDKQTVYVTEIVCDAFHFTGKKESSPATGNTKDEDPF
jgi:single-strand DNA-binding protein